MSVCMILGKLSVPQFFRLEMLELVRIFLINSLSALKFFDFSLELKLLGQGILIGILKF